MASLLGTAWRIVPVLPRPLSRALFDIGGQIGWALHGKQVRQLERNLARVRPEATKRQLRRLARAGMRSYMRYYDEVLRLQAITPEQIMATVRLDDRGSAAEMISSGISPVLALSHSGNWDLAGAFASLALAPVTAPAERLTDTALFEAFCRTRRAVGMTVIPVDKGKVFGAMVEAMASQDTIIMAILADRDLSHGGIEVEWFGQPARLAPGPAALAIATGAPLAPVSMHSERLRGPARRAARSPWGYVLTFWPGLKPDPTLEGTDQVRELTGRWAAVLAEVIAQHPTDWHMLQKVFVADLDRDRDAAIRAADAADAVVREADADAAPAHIAPDDAGAEG